MLLKNGTKGENVKELQKNLQKLGYNIEADGIFGPKTEEAVKTFQKTFNYTVDGIVGDGTTKLIAAQIAYGWNATDPKALELAAKSNPGNNANA